MSCQIFSYQCQNEIFLLLNKIDGFKSDKAWHFSLTLLRLPQQSLGERPSFIPPHSPHYVCFLGPSPRKQAEWGDGDKD